MNSILDAVKNVAVPTDVYGMGISVVLSFVASVIVAMLYYVFFENRRRGAQSHRFFMVGGPSITVLLLAIQFSLPLSLGLLGALSIIRFRTPVKEPEEVSYIILLIAVAITCATFNFRLTGIVLVMATFAFFIQKYAPVVFLKKRKGGLIMLTFSGGGAESGHDVERTLKGFFPASRFESVSASEGYTSYHYSFESNEVVDVGSVIAEIRKKLDPVKASIVFNE